MGFLPRNTPHARNVVTSLPRISGKGRAPWCFEWRLCHGLRLKDLLGPVTRVKRKKKKKKLRHVAKPCLTVDKSEGFPEWAVAVDLPSWYCSCTVCSRGV